MNKSYITTKLLSFCGLLAILVLSLAVRDYDIKLSEEKSYSNKLKADLISTQKELKNSQDALEENHLYVDELHGSLSDLESVLSKLEEKVLELAEAKEKIK